MLPHSDAPTITFLPIRPYLCTFHHQELAADVVYLDCSAAEAKAAFCASFCCTVGCTGRLCYHDRSVGASSCHCGCWVGRLRNISHGSVHKC